MAEQIEITYADKVFKLSAGQKITFKGGKVMQSDIGVKAVEAEEVKMATVEIIVTGHNSGAVCFYDDKEFISSLPVGTTTITVPIGSFLDFEHDSQYISVFETYTENIEPFHTYSAYVNGDGSIQLHYTAGGGGSND